jgi:hypothetical protein
MRGQAELYDLLNKLDIKFEYYEHPPLATMMMLWNTGTTLTQGNVRTSFSEIIKGTVITL